VKSIETAVEAMVMAPGALPRPGRVPKKRLLSPEIGLQRRWRCGTFLGKMPNNLGFSLRRLYIGEGAMSEGGQGPHTIGWRVWGSPAPPGGVVAPGPPPTLLWTPSRVGGK
jgi:hypothetical protein